jgi:hypothetical protein
VRIIGVEDILNIFEVDKPSQGQDRATYNGIMPLQFITKADAKRK